MANEALIGLEKFSLGVINLERFHARVEEYLQFLGIRHSAKSRQIDHIGIRLADNDSVNAVKEHLTSHEKGNIISTAEVNGRPIFIIELSKPLTFGNWQIPCLELPFPAVKHKYPDGFEHIEIVISSQAKTLDDFRPVFLGEFPHLTSDRYLDQYSESSPHAQGDQLPNPTIALKRDLQTGIKFHPLSIKEIVSQPVK